MKDFFKKLSKPQPEVEDLDTGYDSEYYFIRKFKALTGMSPGEYRKTANEIDEKHQSYFFD